MAVTTYLEAGRRAVSEALAANADVVAVGEDLGRGGVFGQYKGLQEEFGADRVIDTPISEASIMGASVGMALLGMRPIVELRFSDFALCAIDELINQAAKARYMFGGQGRVPVVARLPIGMWRSSAAQHSQSLEAWFAHIPGLVVVTPATAADNYALLAAAIASDDPVVYMEHKDLWGMEGEVGNSAGVELGKAHVARAGDDATIVTWSKTVHVALAAAEAVAEDGLSVEVLDLRTLWPWDREAVFSSVARTGRLLVTHEAVQVAGFGAEIAATVAEVMDPDLKAPVRRLGAPRIPIAYAPPLEDLDRVTADNIATAIGDLMRADRGRRAAEKG
jgi:pyruvate/2-oxoglutarate/acetoin dehydrogenase E1 component